MTTTTDRAAQADLAARAIHLMVNGTLDDFRRVVHPEATNREAASEPPNCRGRGPNAFWGTARWLRTAFADMAFGISTVLVDGDLAVTHGTVSGRHVGDMVIWTPEATVERAFAPTGKRFEVNHAHFLRFRDGLVVEHWAVRDDQSLAMQLGWVPPTPVYLLRCALATRRHRRAG
ncbi:ester cyclase [Pseudonocardia humida]|uniref:Ester cyclase n=1 Tax=Pseudonocardia humida TaxID=2800819 RepID=A0ABT1A8W7_9PSEU|nr:ester cyclase [Pseudonocardia humida]MCO1659469.1 ester cyclase [Pseudonocardia humida]